MCDCKTLVLLVLACDPRPGTRCRRLGSPYWSTSGLSTSKPEYFLIAALDKNRSLNRRNLPMAPPSAAQTLLEAAGVSFPLRKPIRFRTASLRRRGGRDI